MLTINQQLKNNNLCIRKDIEWGYSHNAAENNLPDLSINLQFNNK